MFIFNESHIAIATVSFTDLDQGREILSRFSLPKSMKYSVECFIIVGVTLGKQFSCRQLVIIPVR